MKLVLRRLILLLVRLYGLPGTRTRSRRIEGSAPRILLIRPDHLGDLVLMTPVLQALRERLPQAHITLLIGPWSSEVVARHPAVDLLRTCPFPGFQRAPQGALAPYRLLFSVAQQLRRENYDLALNMRPDFWWGAALIYLAAIPRRIGYAIQPGQTFLTRALPFPDREHCTVSNLRLVSAGLVELGAEPLAEPYTPEHYPLSFHPRSEEQAWINARLEQAGIDVETSLIVIHPGSGAAVKLWRPEAWAACANALGKASPVQFVLTGSPKEQLLLEEIAQRLDRTPLIVTDASIGQLAALLQHATLVLGVDSGPPHLAVAQGTASVHIYGPADYRIFGPWGPARRHLVVAATQRCPDCPLIPCGRLDIPAAELEAHPCVRLIPEARVQEAIASLYSPIDHLIK